MKKILIFVILSLVSTVESKGQSQLIDLASNYASEGNYAEALRLAEESYELDLKLRDLPFMLYDVLLCSEYCSNLKDSIKCEKYISLTKSYLQNSQLKKESISGILTSLAWSSNNIGNHLQAIDLAKENLKMVLSNFKELSPSVIYAYENLALLCENGDKIHDALNYYIKAEQINSRWLESNEPLERHSCHEMIMTIFTFVQRHLKDGIDPSICYQYIPFVVKSTKLTDEEREYLLSDLWAMFKDLNFKEGWIAIYKEQSMQGDPNLSLTALCNILAEDENIALDSNANSYSSILYSIFLNNDEAKYFYGDRLDLYYMVLGRYLTKIENRECALNVYKRYYDWLKENGGDNGKIDINLLIAAAFFPNETDYTIALGKEVIESKRYENDTFKLNMIYELMAKAYTWVGDLEIADYYLGKISDPTGYEELYSKCNAYLLTMDFEKILPIAIELNKYDRIDPIERAGNLITLMLSARMCRRKDILLDNSDLYVSEYRNDIVSNIVLMDEKEQNKFLNNHPLATDMTFDFFIGLDKDTIQWAATQAAYDYALLKKGISLSTNTQFRNSLRQTQDSKISEKWEKLLSIDTQNGDDNFLEYELLKRELINYISNNSPYITKLSYTWKDVKNTLREGEAAIEFVKCFNFYNSFGDECEPLYMALLVTNKLDKPIAIPCGLFHDTYDLSDVDSSDMLEYIFNSIWEPIIPYLNGVDKIYFSPIEQMHSIPMEYAYSHNGRANELWDLIRVSSTREIINNPNVTNKSDIILFGGLKYDLALDDLIEESHNGLYHSTTANRSLESGTNRYGVDYLPGTLIEVERIASFYKNKDAACTLITGDMGTEESFKSLSNQSAGVIHIATHGFFWRNEIAEQRSYLNFMSSNDNVLNNYEDYSLLRSGLFFSGANICLKGDSLPNDIEDGVLTAYELSNMNLGNVDMVVLSACDSGLGETTSEGVFGLQRGFKLAGANTLLMSLWKVDDEATCLLMTEFYKHLLSGKSKRESLSLAQATLRQHPDYSDPHYWAAFILLDALK